MCAVKDFIWTTDALGNAAESAAWCEHTGQSAAEIKGLGWLAALHPKDQEPTRERWLRAVAERVPYETEYRLRGRDGFYRTFLAHGVPVLDEAGGIRQWVGFCTDITQRKQAEAAERHAVQAAEQLRHSLQAINACVDLDSALAGLLDESLKLSGLHAGAIYLLEKEEAVLRHQCNLPAEFVRQLSRRPLSLDYIQSLLQNPGVVLNVTAKFPEHHRPSEIHGLRFVYSLALVMKSGPFGFMNLVSLAAQPPDDSAMERIRILVLETESTFKRLALSHRLQLVLATMAEGVVVHGAHGEITDCNPSAERILGLSREEIMGRKPVDPRWRAVHPDGRDFPPAEHPAMVTLRTGQPVQDTTMGIWQPDGRQKWISINTQPMLVPGEGGQASVVVSFSDITRRRQLEERLRHSQKMKAIGQLSGGVAHEFNNILAALMMNLELARALHAETEVQERLADMLALSNRAAGLVRQLLAFSRQSRAKLESFDLAVEITRQLSLLKPMLGEDVHLEFGSSVAWPRVNGDKNLIAQVIVNLCLNARDAMKKGGRLTLQLTEATTHPERREESDPVGRQPQICLSFTDTGCGMDAATLQRLFEPFFTTKEVGQGTGLGLATARGIVEQHGGRMTVESEAGRGATFRVYLPSQPPPLAAAQAAGRAPTILVVDDEPAIRSMTRLFLKRAGFAVLEAPNGREALELWRRHQAEINLVFTDLTMPGDLSGLQLMEIILAESPGMKGIITSGYSPDLVDLNKVATANVVYLPKPCPTVTVLEIIRKCLQAEGN